MYKTKLPLLLLVLTMFLSACKANLARNDDGSLTVETTISQAELQEVVTAAIADPLVKAVTVTLETGSAIVTGERQRLNDAAKTDTLRFRLTLGVSNGQLTSSISEATLDGVTLEAARVDHWNETIANRIANFGQGKDNQTLQSVTITPTEVRMVWSVQR